MKMTRNIGAFREGGESIAIIRCGTGVVRGWLLGSWERMTCGRERRIRRWGWWSPIEHWGRRGLCATQRDFFVDGTKPLDVLLQLVYTGKEVLVSIFESNNMICGCREKRR